MESLCDFDTNKVTLMYMAKGINTEGINRIDTEKHTQYKKDIKFYRKRVFSEMKNLIRGDFKNDRLRNLHNEYVHTIIQYLKDEDRAEILQKDYPPHVTDESTPAFDGVSNLPDDATLNDANACLMRDNLEAVPTMDQYVNIKRVHVDAASFPKIRELNIRTEAHRSKGIKPSKHKKATQ